MTLEDTADRSGGKMLISFGSLKVTSRVGYILCSAQSKLLLQAPLFRNFKFQDSGIRASKETQDPVHLHGSHALEAAPGRQCVDNSR